MHNPKEGQNRAVGIQILSAATCKMNLYVDSHKISVGSGFFLMDSENYFLVTALHNLSGRDYFSRKCLSDTLAIPNNFSATVRILDFNQELLMKEIRGELYQCGHPIFFYDWSPSGGDVAVIKVPRSQDAPRIVTFCDANSNSWEPFAGLDVVILGYPSALDISGTPIWKRASIASEPSLRVNENNITLLDGLTYRGMSGGPVIIYQTQGITEERVYEINTAMSVRLLGVYGGRYRVDEDKSGMLGFFWPMETVKKIINESRQIGDLGM
jgi:hypothetical protein